MSEIYLYENKLINVDTSTECFCKDVLLPKTKINPFLEKGVSQYTHCLRARELGRNVEVDEILSHDNV